jgi:UDP-N-acetylglucosamine 2-epimerase (non-hydrolysing)
MAEFEPSALRAKVKVLCVFGTRPEAIKMAPVIDAMRKSPSIEVKVCVTGQHREMLQQALSAFDIQPDVNLDLMTTSQDLTDLTACILRGVRDVVNQARPDLVMVHGDTTTTFSASLAAFYSRTPVAHIEAGLRTGNHR